MKKLLNAVLLCVLAISLTGCAGFNLRSCTPVESVGVNDSDPRIPFTEYYEGFISFDYNSKNQQPFGMGNEHLYTDEKEWKNFTQEYLPEVTSFPKIDFDSEALYVIINRGGPDFARSMKVKELAYNDENFVVIITQEGSTTQDIAEGESCWWLSILKVKKADFPEGNRAWLMIPEKKDSN